MVPVKEVIAPGKSNAVACFEAALRWSRPGAYVYIMVLTFRPPTEAQTPFNAHVPRWAFLPSSSSSGNKRCRTVFAQNCIGENSPQHYCIHRAKAKIDKWDQVKSGISFLCLDNCWWSAMTIDTTRFSEGRKIDCGLERGRERERQGADDAQITANDNYVDWLSPFNPPAPLSFSFHTQTERHFKKFVEKHMLISRNCNVKWNIKGF